ncbi:CHAT domain-containing protein [bacterium]|nr:CHAT domain-containing protein [bacterium]
MVCLKKITGLLIFLSATLLLWAECPETLEVKPVLNNGGIPELKTLAIQLEDCPDRRDSLAVVYHKLGVKYYIEDDYDSAIFFAEKTLKIREQLFAKNPTIDLGKSYRNLGTFYSVTGQTTLANKRLKKGIEVFKKLSPTPKINNYIIESYLSLVRNYRSNGEFQLAEDFLNLIFIESENSNNPEQQADAFLEQGSILDGREEPKQAVIFFEKSNYFYLKEYSSGSEICYNNLGKSYYKLGDYSKSIQNYTQAIEIIRQAGFSSNLAITYNNLGMSYLKNKETKKALLAFQKGLKNAVASKSSEAIAQSHNHFAEYYQSKNDYPNALTSSQNAIKALVPLFDPENDANNPRKEDLVNAEDKIGLLIYLSDKAKILSRGTLSTLSAGSPDDLQGKNTQATQRQYLLKALELFELGDILVDQIRHEHSDENTKLFWRKKVLPFYEDALETCYQLQDMQKVFFFLEKSKAILLLDALRESVALDAVPDSIRNKTYLLKKQLLEARRNLNLSSEKKEGEKEKWLQKIIFAQKLFDDHMESIRVIYPKSFSKKAETNTYALFEHNEIFSNRPHCSLVHFFYGHKNVYAFVSNSKKSTFLLIGKSKKVEQQVRKFVSFFESGSAIENAPEEFIAQSKALYDLLIKPLFLSDTKELVIFPDGALAYLPFEALLSSLSSSISDAPYLIKNVSIRYGYSATIASSQRSRIPRKSKKEIAAFAPFAGASSNINYAPLAFSNDELGQISHTISGCFFKNDEATKRSFLTLKDKYAVIHLSTHAFSSAEESHPKIVFSDTVLFLSELYALEIPADLVVLSACQTNIGKLSPGEGVMSLGRGFTYAGAQSLVSSLWNVNAASTSNILAGFYTNLQEGMEKHEALHQAKLSYLEDETIPYYERSPYYWAGLVYYGDRAQIVLHEKMETWQYGVIGILLLLLVGGFFYWWRKGSS